MKMGKGETGRIGKLGAVLLASTALATVPLAAFGQVTIDGSDVVNVPGDEASPWLIPGDGELRVGDTANSDAILNIVVGEVNNVTARVGNASDSKGTVNVTGVGSIWTSTGNLRVGSNGDGTVTVSGGARLNTNAQAQIGLYSSALGNVIVQGANSEWEAGSGIFAGGAGEGNVRVESGGIVRTGASNTIIGSDDGGNGTVVVTGAGSSWSTANLRVGSGPIMGNGTLGTLNIENSGVFSAIAVDIGYNESANGTLRVSGTGSSLTVTAGDFHVGREGVGTLVLDDGAELVTIGLGYSRRIGFANGSQGSVTISNGAHWDASGQVIRIAHVTGSQGALNIGGGIDGWGNPLAATGAGMLTANNISFGGSDGQLNFNHTETAYNFTPGINGDGMINHFAGTTTIGDLTSFNGHVNVEGGTLFVNSGSGLGMTMGVLGSGRVGGGGFIRDLTVGNGGTLAPGNSIGTIFAGTATFDDGSIFEVEISDGGNWEGVHNDFLDASSGPVTVNAGATFHVIPENGTDDGSTYAANTRYTVIRAGTLNVNAMPTITDTFAFLDFTGSHDPLANEFYLTSSAAAASFCLAGASTNQCATGEAVRQLGAGNPAYDEAVAFTPAQAAAGFDLASGEIHASGQHVIDQTFRLFNTTLLHQGGGASRGAAPAASALMGYAPAAPRAAGVSAIDGATASFVNESAYAWVAPLGARGAIKADGNADALDWWSFGLAGGYESSFALGGGDFTGGLGVGYLRSGGNASARLSTMQGNGLHLGAYGAWNDGALSLTGSLSYAADHITTSRGIVFGALNPTAQAGYWNHTVGLSSEFAYAIELDGALTVSPLFKLDAGWSGHGGYAETGAGALNLTVAGGGHGWFDVGLGIALAHDVETEAGTITLEGSAMWEHAFAGTVPATSNSFAGSPAAFTVSGTDAGRDRLRLGAGVAFDIGADMTMRARYDGLFSGSQQNHTGSVGLSVRF